jgi:hypothetical protein
MTDDPRLKRIVAAQPYPLLFATISRRRSVALASQGGACLYGFPSPDSDFGLRGAHVLPLEKVIRLMSAMKRSNNRCAFHLTPALSQSNAEREAR